MLNLLAQNTDSGSNNANNNTTNTDSGSNGTRDAIMYSMIGVAVGILLVWGIFTAIKCK